MLVQNLFDNFHGVGFILWKSLNFQILDWLSHSPTDIESYIRPGCIILTIYLRLGESAWEEVCFVTDGKMGIASIIKEKPY